MVNNPLITNLFFPASTFLFLGDARRVTVMIVGNLPSDELSLGISTI